MEDLAENLNIKNIEDFYLIKHKHFISNGGSSILSYYKYSIPSLLLSVFPEKTWSKEKFKNFLEKSILTFF